MCTSRVGKQPRRAWIAWPSGGHDGCGTARAAGSAGIPAKHVSVGASHPAGHVRPPEKECNPRDKEIHPGHCTIGDIWHVRALAPTLGSVCGCGCVQRDQRRGSEYVIIDAGYKTFSADAHPSIGIILDFFWQGKPSFGSVQGRPDLWLGGSPPKTATVSYMGRNSMPGNECGSGIGWKSSHQRDARDQHARKDLRSRHGMVERVFRGGRKGLIFKHKEKIILPVRKYCSIPWG